MKNIFTPPYAALLGSLSPVARSFTRSASTVIGASVLVGALTAQEASAVSITVTAIDNGSSVIFSYSGSITDLTGFTGSIPSVSIHGVVRANVGFIIGPAPSGTLGLRTGTLTGPNTIGTGITSIVADASSGSPFYLRFGSSTIGIGLPTGYTLGTTISGTSTYTGKSFSDLGITTGSYSWTLNNTAKDVITLNASATPVPFESDALPLVGVTLFMAGGLWWKKKRAQAKVTDFVTKE